MIFFVTTFASCQIAERKKKQNIVCHIYINIGLTSFIHNEQSLFNYTDCMGNPRPVPCGLFLAPHPTPFRQICFGSSPKQKRRSFVVTPGSYLTSGWATGVEKKSLLCIYFYPPRWKLKNLFVLRDVITDDNVNI